MIPGEVVSQKDADLAVGGLTGIGSRAPSLLLVANRQRRVGLDCRTGERIPRDNQESGDWFDASQPVARSEWPGLRVTLALSRRQIDGRRPSPRTGCASWPDGTTASYLCLGVTCA